MQVLVLGPIEARSDGRQIPLGAAKQRAVLAMLALHANSTVSADELMEGLWGEHPPASAHKMVQQYVSQLRRLLADGDAGEASIVTRGRGYELQIPPDDIDAERFVRLVSRGSTRQALALWRGGALDDIADEPFAAVEIRRLQELRLDAIEQAIDADLADGRHGVLIGELEALISENPLSERLRGQLMLALYRSGRQAEALEAYARARRQLVDDIGIEPGPDLQRLNAAILSQDPSLDAPARPELPPEFDVSSPMFGRETELARLRAAWTMALDGRDSTFVIEGPEGSGRARIAAQLAHEVHAQGGLVLVGTNAPPHHSRAVLLLEDADEGLMLRIVSGAVTEPPEVERIALGPLSEAAIGRIARQYGQEHAVETLVERSRGLPGEAHRIAAAWAREEAERRVTAEALRTAGEREGLREAERRLSGQVTELQSMRERTERHDPRTTAAVVCPYKGLASFDRDDADFFFGRGRLVAEMVARLVGAPLLGIVGASGSGKSSVLRAGLLAELAKGVLPGSEAWAQVLMRPGEHPATTLQRLASKAHADRRTLIAVDQFEEVFTLCRDPSERAAFVGALVETAKQDDAAVLVAVRADFYGRCAEYPALGALLGANQLLVGAMRRDELRRAIEMPALRAGLHVEPELVDALLEDTVEEPGALPLLSTALLELWQHRDGRRMSLAAYERTGRVRGAVARIAERAYKRLDPVEQGAARRILLRLTGDAGPGGYVRRRVPLAELEGDGVLDALTGSRLVTVSEGTAEVAHEALLQEWPRLQGWLEEDAAGRRVHAHLIQAAHEWSHDRSRGELYRGARLASALEWRAEHEPDLNTTERQFLDASRLASERARRRIRLTLAGVTALLVVAAAAAIVAIGQRGRAQGEARAAEAQRLGAQALNTDAVDLSLLLARQGVALDDERATQLNLLAALRRSPAVVGALQPGISGLLAIEQPAAGRVLAVGDLDASVAFVDLVSRRRIAAHRAKAGATGITVVSAPDGSRVAALRSEYQGGSFVDVFDGRSGRLISELTGRLDDVKPESATFSPDSRELFVQGVSYDNGGVQVFRWDVRGQGHLRDIFQIPGNDHRLLGFAGAQLLTYSSGEHVVVARDPATLRAQRRFPVPVGVTAAATSSGVLAMAIADGSLRLLDLRSGRMRISHGRHQAPVTALAFTPDGRSLVSAGRDDRLNVWNARTATAVESLETGAAGTISDLVVTSDARTAYSAGRDGTILTWDLQGSRRFERPLRLHDGSQLSGRALVAPPRGARFAAIDSRGAIDVFDSRSLRLVSRIRLGGRRRAVGAAIAPDGRTLATTDLGGRVQFWDLSIRKPLGEPVLAHSHEASSVLFSADGSWLVTGGEDHILHLWDARTHRLHTTLDVGSSADLDLNPQGTLLAVTPTLDSVAGGLELVSVPDLEVVGHAHAPVGNVARFTPDGRSLIFADRQGLVQIYDTHTLKPRGRPLDSTSPILNVNVSPDGKTLATTSADGKVGLWDLASRRAIGSDPPSTSGDLVGAGFIDRGRQLVVLHDRGGFAWDLRPASWERHACTVAGRALTRAEWKEVLPDRPYAPACAAGR